MLILRVLKEFEITNSNKKIKIVSIVDEKIEFYDSLPPTWAYEEVITAEKETNKLLNILQGSSQERQFTLIPSLSQYSIFTENVKIEDGDWEQTYRKPFFENLIIPNRD